MNSPTKSSTYCLILRIKILCRRLCGGVDFPKSIDEYIVSDMFEGHVRMRVLYVYGRVQSLYGHVLCVNQSGIDSRERGEAVLRDCKAHNLCVRARLRYRLLMKTPTPPNMNFEPSPHEIDRYFLFGGGAFMRRRNQVGQS